MCIGVDLFGVFVVKCDEVVGILCVLGGGIGGEEIV